MKEAFIKWALGQPAVGNRPVSVLRQDMEDIDTVAGAAWLAWKAAWRAKR